MTLGRKLAYLAVGNLLAVLAAAVAIEVAGRVFLAVRPSYEVLFLQPDRAVGWKGVPGLRFTWAGADWYAKDFSTDVQLNSLGFRDRERTPAKTPGTIRVALLGDSFVEALQVPLEGTAAALLERRLNVAGATAVPPRRYEVLNFGVSNFGVGQYLLAWEAYARRFAPDYVFVFVGSRQVARTVERWEIGAFRTTASRWLSIRPTFALRGEELVREPARDFDAFVATQQRLVEEEFDGGRARQRETSVIAHHLRLPWRRRFGPVAEPPPPPPSEPPQPAETLAINLAVLGELGRQVRAAAAVLVIVDVATFYDPSASALETALVRLASEEGFGYLPLGARLEEARRQGIWTRWAHDGHLSAEGNEIFAAALYDWITTTAPSPSARPPHPPRSP